MTQRRVVLSHTATSKPSALLEYLEGNWSIKVKNDFINKLDQHLLTVSKYPQSCPESNEIKGLHRCVVSKHNTIYYRINRTEIEIVTLFDTRQDQSKI